MRTFRDFIILEENKNGLSNLIKAELKKLGLKLPKDASVRKLSGGHYIVYLKTFNVDFDKVRDAVIKFENVQYDEFTNEILSGGNTFVMVQYDSDFEMKEHNRLQKMEDEIIQKWMEDKANWIKVGNKLEIAIPTNTDERDIRNKQFRYEYKLNGKSEYVKYWILPIWQVLAKAGF